MGTKAGSSNAAASVRGLGLGTAPVFLAGISTILGAILFLRFGYAVGHTGLIGAIAIVLIGHAITIPTGLAVAEIATNLRVEGGGEYFIISRSFGGTVGGAIGISLYFSQAISVAFYLIAFAEAFRPLFPLFEQYVGIPADPRMVSLPAALLLTLVIIRRGASIGVGLLWVVVSVLAVSLVMFFLGGPRGEAPMGESAIWGHVADPDPFFIVFAIIFPAFTGMTAGVGLSGDLRNPRRSIPLGTLAATLTGMVVYILIVLKMAYSASPAELASDQFVMGRIALWGPIIPIGLAAATISSAIGSILVAPRTLQALAADHILPAASWNRALAKGRGEANEPVNATWLTALIMVAFVAAGSVDFVAQIISMFFMITYGALCAVSFLEHFAGNPSYRPAFRTKWYISLVGAVASFVMMFQMSPLYASFAVLMMGLIYYGLQRSHSDQRNLTAVMRGVLYQLTRRLQLLIQNRGAETEMTNWRPSFVALSHHSANRVALFDLVRWFSHYHGFGSYIHFVPAPLTIASNQDSERMQVQLVTQARDAGASVYVDTIISPSFKTAVAQIVQVPGMAGMENNSILFEFEKEQSSDLADIINGCHFAAIKRQNIGILRASDRHFGYHRSIHVWLNPGDLRNANLMILLAYILVGHPEWRRAQITLYAAFEPEDMDERVDELRTLIAEGRIPITQQNVQPVALEEGTPFDQLVSATSSQADLVITGFSLKKMIQDKGRFLRGFDAVQDILFVRAGQRILITTGEEDEGPLLPQVGEEGDAQESEN